MATYEIAYNRSPSSLKFNGVALTSYASIAAAEAAGRGWVDLTQTVGKVYVVLDGGDTPWSGVILAILPFYFATKPKAFTTGANAHKYYESRIEGLPNLSLRVEPNFGGVAQIGGGSLKLSNLDGFFNDKLDYFWNAGETVLRMGVDVPDSAMAYSDYEVIGTWGNGAHDADETEFGLKLNEKKHNLKTQLPLEAYARAEYTGIDERAIGRPIPLAYGVLYAARAVCINTFTREFKLATHPIYAIDTVRYLDGTTNIWTTITPTSTDLSEATFILPSSWNGRDAVAADFKGRKIGTSLMVNAADIVADILTSVGETNHDTASFAASKLFLEYGTVAFENNPTATTLQPSILIDNRRAALDIIADINAAVGAYLFCGADGSYYYKVFKPIAGESLPIYTAADIESFNSEHDSSDVISGATIRYAERYEEDWAETVTVESTAALYTNGQTEIKTRTTTEPLSLTAHAAYLAQRSLVANGAPQRQYRIRVPWKGILLTPSSQVTLIYAGNGNNVNQIFEVLEQKIDIKSGIVDLTLGNLHGFESCGFWVADAAVLPTRFANYTEYGVGSLVWNPLWAAEIKAWAKQNVAYWTDANGFADSTDPDSFLPSRWF